MPLMPSASVVNQAASSSVAYTENTTLFVTATGSEQSLGLSTVFTSDGTSKYLIEIYIPNVAISTSGDAIKFHLRENPSGANTDRGLFGRCDGPTTGWGCSFFARRVITPAAGSVTYDATVVRTAGTGGPICQAGDGSAGNYVAASLRVSIN